MLSPGQLRDSPKLPHHRRNFFPRSGEKSREGVTRSIKIDNFQDYVKDLPYSDLKRYQNSNLDGYDKRAKTTTCLIEMDRFKEEKDIGTDEQ